MMHTTPPSRPPASGHHDNGNVIIVKLRLDDSNIIKSMHITIIMCNYIYLGTHARSRLLDIIHKRRMCTYKH